jgi:hypothetical protein
LIDGNIIRGENGRRHEVEFGDAPVRVEIHASEETFEIFIEADSKSPGGESPYRPSEIVAVVDPARQAAQRSTANSS